MPFKAIKHSRAREEFPETCEEGQRRKEAKEKGTLVQLKHRKPALLPREARFMRANEKTVPEVETIHPYEFALMGVEKTEDLDC